MAVSGHLRRLGLRLDARFAAHATVVFVCWPVATLFFAALDARHLPYYDVSWLEALALASAGLVILAPDVALIGTLVCLASIAVFSRLGRTIGERAPFRRFCLEPVVFLLAIFCGTSLWYPTILSHPLWLPFWPVPAVIVLALAVVVGLSLICELAPRGRRLPLAAALAVIGVIVPLPTTVGTSLEGTQRRPSDIVVLGLDSVAQTDDVRELRGWIQSNAGAWYSHAVTPGLLTNAVWASVITAQPVREHGVFHTFQRLPPDRARLVSAARRAGYRTVSLFPDQLTCSIGSDAGFEEDRSGPKGWRQLVLRIVQNSSILLPLVRPLLPKFPWSPAPPNHGGTFTYDLDREIREVLFSGEDGRRTLVAAHLTYLHNPAYPRLVDLSWDEVRKVATAPAGSLRDRSFDWQDREYSEDAIPLRRWKLARLQKVLVSALEDTGFTNRGGRLLVFSDHGDRAGLTTQTFADTRFHHVILATVGLPSRALDEPISLIDIGSLLGFLDARSSDPAVEFAISPPTVYPLLLNSARLHWSGTVELDSRLLGDVFRELRFHRPWTMDLSRRYAGGLVSLSREPQSPVAPERQE
jgi:hypothetical protein